ncbi:MAG: GWxTD domain-containing protein [Catalinimonas sp.]
MRFLLSVFVVVLVAGCTSVEHVSKQNLAHRYAPQEPLELRGRTVDDGDNLRVYLRIDARKLGDDATSETLQKRYRFDYRILPSYKSRQIIKEAEDVAFDGYHGRDARGRFHVSLLVERYPVESVVLVVRAVERSSGKSLVFDLPIFPSRQSLDQKYALFGVRRSHPVVDDYLTTADTVIIRAPRGGEQMLKVHYYQDAFRPALPPMALNNSVRRRPERDQLYFLKPGEVMKFAGDGLYFAQEDTTVRDGFSFVVNRNKFPRVTRAEELIAPLIYISTRKERERLARADNPKLALDRFWLKLANDNKDYARRMIRAYYTRVQEANDRFTTFKEGWMTDQGMIYVVFGPPAKLLRFNDREEWYYEKSSSTPETYFVFRRRPTIFTDENYELVRYNEYDRIWYRNVEQWRKGIGMAPRAGR